MLTYLSTYACWYPNSMPNDNMIYRLQEDVSKYFEYNALPFLDSKNNLFQDYTFRDDNIKLWKKQTNTQVGDRELEDIVYRLSFRELKAKHDYYEGIIGKEGYSFLCLAKQCEELRANLNDPWYYPSKDDSYTDNLEAIANKAIQYRGKWLNRYALQAIRALVSLKKDSVAVEYWGSISSRLDDDVIRIMAERHIASAYYNIGHRDKAMHIYAKAGDITSLYYIYVLENNDPYINPIGSRGKAEVIRYVYEECPNSPFMKDVLQSILTHFDNNHMQNRHNYYCCRSTEDELSLINDIIAVAKQAVKDKRVIDKAMWLYVLAALNDVKGASKEALRYIAPGIRECRENSFMANSFRVLRIYLEAKTCTYDSVYIEQLAKEAKWLSNLARSHITSELKTALTPRTVNSTWGNYTPDIEYYNKMYWSDAINRIFADELATRLKKEGKITDALLVSNLGEFWLPKNAYGHAHIKNAPSLYCITDMNNTMATIADSCKSWEIIRMYKRLRHPQNALDRIVSMHGKTDSNYWRDIIGTHLIAEHKYNEAVKWLEKCSHSYQKTVGTWDWYDRDPFCLMMGWHTTKRHHIENRYDYKLNYAKKMLQLEKKIHYTKNKNERAEAMILYGVGLRNQSDWCWSLSRNADRFDEHDELIDKKNSQKWIDKGLALMTNKERKAYYLHEFGRNKEVQDLCFDTKIAKNMRAHCDLWRDYRKN